MREGKGGGGEGGGKKKKRREEKRLSGLSCSFNSFLLEEPHLALLSQTKLPMCSSTSCVCLRVRPGQVSCI